MNSILNIYNDRKRERQRGRERERMFFLFDEFTLSSLNYCMHIHREIFVASLSLASNYTALFSLKVRDVLPHIQTSFRWHCLSAIFTEIGKKLQRDGMKNGIYFFSLLFTRTGKSESQYFLMIGIRDQSFASRQILQKVLCLFFRRICWFYLL